MSIDTSCGIMVGLPYKEMVKLFDDPEILNALIYEGTMSRSSIWYDSDSDRNVVGLWVAYSCGFTEVDMGKLTDKIVNCRKILAELTTTGTTFNVYLAVDIT